MNPIRQSVRGPIPKPLKSSSIAADSDQPHHNKPVTEKSPKLQGDRRSPRGNGNAARSSDPSNQKKLGNRVADLESQLGQAQGELKILKHQLASTRAPKRATIKTKSLNEGSDEIQPETDVFEVPLQSTILINKVVDLSPPPPDQPDTRNDEVISLKAQINDKDTEMETSKRKKVSMKTKIDDLNSDMGLVRTKETEMTSKMNQLFGDLEQSKSVEADLKAKLERLEAEKNAMETEMKMMRVQMEQWRKAAEAAAIVLSAEVETNRGMESIVADDDDDIMDDDGFAAAAGKKKGSGIRKIGEMLKKKVQK